MLYYLSGFDCLRLIQGEQVKADEVDAVEADSIAQITGLSNLIIPIDTNAAERETARGARGSSS